MSEEKCNFGETLIKSTAAGVNTFSPQCYNYLGAASLSFNPPTVTDPTDCTDAQWLYALNPSVSLPSNLQVGFDTSLNSVIWGTSDGTSPGYDASF